MELIKYPNLELMVYQFEDMLKYDVQWQKKLAQIGCEITPKFDVTMFSQVWGSPNTAFDLMPSGVAMVGESGDTRAYTVIIEEVHTQTYGVFVNSRFCYMVSDPSEEFYQDMKDHNMCYLSKAVKRY